MEGGCRLTILGAGVAEAQDEADEVARAASIPFSIHEARGRVGGNCTTFSCGPFRYDSGAHRLHDRDPEVLEELRTLLEGRLRRIAVPSVIPTSSTV